MGAGWKPLEIQETNGSYVIDQLWLIDSDGDGIYNMYSFDEDGILYDGSSDRFDHGQFGGYGGNKFGTFYSDGRMIANNYHSDRQKAGPYEVIKKNGLWTDGSGMIGNNNNLNIPITDNYYIDALGIQVGIDLYQATLDVSGTIYKN